MRERTIPLQDPPADQFTSSNHNVAQVAFDVGYESEAAFHAPGVRGLGSPGCVVS